MKLYAATSVRFEPCPGAIPYDKRKKLTNDNDNTRLNYNTRLRNAGQK